MVGGRKENKEKATGHEWQRQDWRLSATNPQPTALTLLPAMKRETAVKRRNISQTSQSGRFQDKAVERLNAESPARALQASTPENAVSREAPFWLETAEVVKPLCNGTELNLAGITHCDKLHKPIYVCS